MTEEVVEMLRGRKRLRSRLRKKWEKMGMRGGGEKKRKATEHSAPEFYHLKGFYSSTTPGNV